MLDLRIINATVVTEAGCTLADIGIEGESIVEVVEPGRLGPGRVEIDAEGLYAMPGAIDVHFHCRAPSNPERGDFGSETAAAAAGGVATVFEMPISDPACSTPEVLQSRRALVERDAFVNVALYAGAAVPTAAQATAMAEVGAIGFKLFTIAPAPGRESEFEGLWATDDAAVYAALAAVAETGLRCVVHAESDSLLSYFLRLPAVNGIPARPPAAEAAAIASAAVLAKETGAQVHIAHVSSRSALDVVRGALAMGTQITAETCPQYLLLDHDAIAEHGSLAKIAPPLRSPDDREALWDAIVDGTLTVVASDHSPFLLHEKLNVDYALAPQGLPTVELLVPTVLDAAVRGVLSLETAVELVTRTPADLFGLERKGRIAVGADADVAIFSLGPAWHPTAGDLHSRAADFAVVFGGVALRARIERTIVNGRLVFDRGTIVDEPHGRFTPGRSAVAQRSAAV